MSEIKVYNMAVCLHPNATTTDFQGPVEILGIFNQENRKLFAGFFKNWPDAAIETEYLSHSLEPVKPTQGPKLVPTMTYEDALKKDWDILLIPGGPNPREAPAGIVDFLKQKGPKTQYVLSVCTGSWMLAYAGLLEGQRATTNKMWYRVVVEATKDDKITWVPQARYVVNDDKHIWTSSGVTAGMDMAYAFLIHLINKEFADEIKAMVEFRTVADSEEDEFAVHYGLV